MDKIIDINEVIRERTATAEYEKNVNLIAENMALDKVNSILHIDFYLDGDEIEWWEDAILKYEISEMDLCYDVLTMDVIKFDDKYKPLIWSEVAEYVFHYLKSYKEDDEYDEYLDFFERLKQHGEKRKMTSIESLRYKKKSEHRLKCLSKGKEGVQQLIDERIEKGFTESDLHGFNNFLEMLEKYNKRPYQIFTDSLQLNAYEFYKLHEWNWYMALAETIYYLASLKWTAPDKYDEAFEIITKNLK